MSNVTLICFGFAFESCASLSQPISDSLTHIFPCLALFTFVLQVLICSVSKSALLVALVSDHPRAWTKSSVVVSNNCLYSNDNLSSSTH